MGLGEVLSGVPATAAFDTICNRQNPLLTHSFLFKLSRMGLGEVLGGVRARTRSDTICNSPNPLLAEMILFGLS